MPKIATLSPPLENGRVFIHVYKTGAFIAQVQFAHDSRTGTQKTLPRPRVIVLSIGTLSSIFDYF